MKKKHVKKMLLVGGALLTTPLAACGPTVVGNPKGCFYDDGAYVDNNGNPCGVQEAGADASDASSDAGDAAPDAPSDAPSDSPDDGG